MNEILIAAALFLAALAASGVIVLVRRLDALERELRALWGE